MTRRGPVRLWAVAAGLLCLAACTAPAHAPVTATAKASDCAKVAAIPLPGKGAKTAVLVVDNSQSGPVRALPPGMAAELAAFQRDRGALTILAVDGAGVNPAVVRTIAIDPAPGNRSRDADIARALAISCVSQWITSKDAQPTRPGSDILAAVNAAIDRQPDELMVLSDGLDNVAPFDLNTIGFGAAPADVVAGLRGDIASAPKGTAMKVVWADLGVTTAHLPEAVRTSLHGLWKAVLGAAGAADVTFMPVDTAVGGVPSGAPSDDVTIPAAVFRKVGCTATLTVPADLLFGPGDATLAGDAGTVLAGAVATLTASPGARVTVVGHTAAYGSRAYRDDLSLRRAAVVAQALRTQGVPGDQLTSTGVGSSQPAVNEFPHGIHDEAAAAQNRRVVITVTPKGCTT